MLREGALLARASRQERYEMEPQEVLTQSDVAALLRVERHTIPKLIELGLPCHHVGSRRRFLRREVLAWLAAQTESE